MLLENFINFLDKNYHHKRIIKFLKKYQIDLFIDVGAVLLGNEFNYFLNNTFSLLKEINYIFGEIHVSPFSSEDNSFRASKILVSIILCLVISFNFFY